ncbi:Serine/threonine-protein kinase plk1 [Phlyctochytrium bullatum]|nr:Serine/threonine-protein kinase plk1 [Phlyctochytrium bullatum]
MLGGDLDTNHHRPDSTDYVPPPSETDASSSHPLPVWNGSINPTDILHPKLIVTNSNCTIEKGVLQGLAVIVKRSTHKELIKREIDFHRRASNGDYIVSFRGWYEEVDMGIVGLVMQKCAMDLRGWSKKAAGLVDLEDKMFRISEGIAKGLAFINNLGIIHNDLKPENVFVDDFNKPYIGDFGVATNRGEESRGYTKQYFDKESLQLIPDELSDSWLLGATFWEFWSDEAFNVEETIHLDHIHNSSIMEILKKLLRPRQRRASAKQILPLFNSTTLRSEYGVVLTGSVSIPEQRPSSLEQSPKPPYANNTDAVRTILSTHAVDVDMPQHNITGLQLACIRNFVGMVTTLLEFGADHSRQDREGKLPIQLSTSLEIWRALATKMPAPQGDFFSAVEKGDDVSARLFLAAAKGPGNTDSVEPILSASLVDVHATKDGLTSLQVACQQNLAGIVEKLLDFGADYRRKDAKGKLPIQLSSSLKVWQALATKTAAPGMDLFDAAQSGDELSARLILGAAEQRPAMLYERKLWDINGSKQYVTPLHVAAAHGHVAVCQVFLQAARGVVEGVYPDLEKTSLIIAAGTGHVDVVRLLTQNGAKIRPGFYEQDALHEAALYGHLEVVRFLVENGAEINSGNQQGETPLIMAAQGGHLPVMQYLVKNSANIDKRSQHLETPLHHAASNGHLSIVEYLVEQGAEIECRNIWTMSPLIMAAWKGYLPVVQYLVKKGAYVGAKSITGKTCQDWAIEHGHTAVAQFLASRERTAFSTESPTAPDSTPQPGRVSKVPSASMMKSLMSFFKRG